MNIANSGQVNVGNDHYGGTLGTALTVSDIGGSGGQLHVFDNSAINNAGFGVIGLRAGSNGSVIVEGENAEWNNNQSLQIGASGDGVLIIRSGGLVSNATGTIGTGAGSTGTVTVDGYNSRWTNSGNLIVADASREANLEVLAGGVVSSSNGYIGNSTNSIGAARVDGNGSTWTMSSRLYVGAYGTGSLEVSNGGLVSNGSAIIGQRAGSSGVVTVTGTGSRWENDNLDVGDFGAGTLNIEAGGVVTNHVANVGRQAGSVGTVTVTGAGSRWENSNLDVGVFGDGNLHVEAGGFVTNTRGLVGFTSGDGTVSVRGNGSRWDNNSTLSLGSSINSHGQLDIANGGQVNVGNDHYAGDLGRLTVSHLGSGFHGILSLSESAELNSSGIAIVAQSAGSTGSVSVIGANSRWNNTSFLDVGRGGTGDVVVTRGGRVTHNGGSIGWAPDAVGSVTVISNGSQWNSTSFLWIGREGQGTLDVSHGGVVNNTEGVVGRMAGSTGTVDISGSGSKWNNSTNLYLGGTNAANGGVGTLNISGGGQVNVGNDVYTGSDGRLTVSKIGSSSHGNLVIRNGSQINNSGMGIVGQSVGSSGSVSVIGAGSHWNNTNFLDVGREGTGNVNVTSGGRLTHEGGSIGWASDAVGTVSVQGNGSQWNSTSFLWIGREGRGTINVLQGGVVNNTEGVVGRMAGSTGTVNVSGTGSQWNNSTNLYLGGTNTTNGGVGTLNISNGGQVNVGNDVYTGTQGRLNVSTIGSGSHGNLVIRNGSKIDNAGLSVVASSAGSRGSVRVTGSGSQWNTAGNLFIGGIDSAAGLGNLNISNQGLVTVGGHTTTWSGSTVTLNNAQFHAEGGWTNHGSLVVAGTGGEIHGELHQGSSGVLVVNGGSTATFHDHVFMSSGNGNLEVGAGGRAVFLGSYNGGSTGPGTVQVLGELNPGNSPGVVSFGGDLVLGTDTLARIELGGIELGTFDQLQIAGDFQVAGLLDVSLINGFSLGFNQEFLIADVSGIRMGYFQGLNEGDLVGNIGGMDLFITYAAGNGGGISLFTAVPEPSSLLLVGFVAAAFATRRQRRPADRVSACAP